MNMKRCSKGHFYDGDQYKSCPHCAGQNAPGELGVTRPITQGVPAPGPHPGSAPGNGKMVQCPNGHFYNASIYSKCPHCNAEPPIPTGGLKKTCPNCGKEYDSHLSSCPYCHGEGKKEKDRNTVPLFQKNVVGWLVAVKGPHKGKDFRLQTGRNFIGRDDLMDVCLRYDNAVSRNKHAVLLYEPKGCTFFVTPGESHELAYLNGEVLLDAKPLKSGDILTLGRSDLMFVPFCSADFNWEKEAEKEKAEKEDK